jgi:hypothetical protein
MAPKHARAVAKEGASLISVTTARSSAKGKGGLAVFAQGITPFSPSMAARETRLRPRWPAAAPSFGQCASIGPFTRGTFVT